MPMASCPDCGSENRQDARFCDACGGRLDLQVAEPEQQSTPTPTEDQDPAFASVADEGEGAVDSMFTGEEGTSDSTAEPEPEIDVTEPESEAPAESVETEEEPPAQTPKAGYLVFPDDTEQPIPPSQWLIGRADVSKFLPDPEKANEISRGHLTVFQEGERFFVEDGKTMVQRKASTNKTWVIRGSDRILVTGTGRTELQDDDEIDIAELVTLQFVVK
ncbi:MAG: FHA domain-containing protein [Methanobacteriota archaeon]|nr:MAG: FHA domain-containing protein [Euryarchaeota archaeon]TLZ65555.1 MAG: FHA domain-containing protein [Euryarchaeota archaeon]